MEFATLDAMFPGRTRIAVGHGVQSWMRQAGAAVASPLTLLREYVDRAAGAPRGTTVTVEGRYVTLVARPVGVPAGAAAAGPDRRHGTEDAAAGRRDRRRRRGRQQVLHAHGARGAGARRRGPGRRRRAGPSTPRSSWPARRVTTLGGLADEAVRQEVPPGDVFGVGGTAAQIAGGSRRLPRRGGRRHRAAAARSARRTWPVHRHRGRRDRPRAPNQPRRLTPLCPGALCRRTPPGPPQRGMNRFNPPVNP